MYLRKIYANILFCIAIFLNEYFEQSWFVDLLCNYCMPWWPLSFLYCNRNLVSWQTMILVRVVPPPFILQRISLLSFNYYHFFFQKPAWNCFLYRYFISGVFNWNQGKQKPNSKLIETYFTAVRILLPVTIAVTALTVSYNSGHNERLILFIIIT